MVLPTVLLGWARPLQQWISTGIRCCVNSAALDRSCGVSNISYKLRLDGATGISQRQSHTEAYQIEVAIKAFELTYLRLASATVRDLLMINLAPKGPSALTGVAASGLGTVAAPAAGSNVTIHRFVKRPGGPVGRRGSPGSGASTTVFPSGTRVPHCGTYAKNVAAAAASPVQLVMPPADEIQIPLNWKKTRFTLIRGPHVDKRGMEQFETRKYKVLLRATTNSSLEVRWFMDQLKMYALTGVQVQVILTANTYLTPAPAQQPNHLALEGGYTGGSGQLHTGSRHGSLLSAHRKRTAEPYLLASAPQEAVLQQRAAARQLSQLWDAVHDGGTLFSAPAAHRAAEHLAAIATSSGMRAEDYSPAELQRQLQQRLLQLQRGETIEAPGIAVEGSVKQGHAAAFLAAVDAVLLSIRFDALESYENFPFHFATFAPAGGNEQGGSVPATGPDARWMQRVLKYGQLMQRLGRFSQERQLLQAYVEYGQFAHALLFRLLSMWLASPNDKQHDMPVPPLQEDMLQQLWQQQQGKQEPRSPKQGAS